jgi:hypothetical protein
MVNRPQSREGIALRWRSMPRSGAGLLAAKLKRLFGLAGVNMRGPSSLPLVAGLSGPRQAKAEPRPVASPSAGLFVSICLNA